jgi:DNA-binding XRE family transcriptional regulator
MGTGAVKTAFSLLPRIGCKSGKTKTPTTWLGQRLRQLRLANNWTQHEMATAMGCRGGAGRISDYELGHHLPTLTMLRRYAMALDMTVADLLDGVM